MAILKISNLSLFWNLKRALSNSSLKTYADIKQIILKNEFERRPSEANLLSVHLSSHESCKVVFDNRTFADFKYIWLRDNCKCKSCVHETTHQKLLDTASIDINIKPIDLLLTDDNHLKIIWPDTSGSHESLHHGNWLYKYGQCFIHNSFNWSKKDLEVCNKRPSISLWTESSMKKDFPELEYGSFIGSDDGVHRWLELLYIYGIVMLRDVPPIKDSVLEIVKRVAYVKETQYGVTFDVINEPDPEAHLAFSGVHLEHHTDMNYREKSPGIQLLHCLEAKATADECEGAKSFFVDGFNVANWLRDNQPLAFHMLASTPVRFQIKNKGVRYSQLCNVISLSTEGEIQEIHYNNRTVAPLQVPPDVVIPFYTAYQMFARHLRQQEYQLSFKLNRGDLIAFNNRRVLHGRTSFNPSTFQRCLQGCYIDYDEVFSKYDSFLLKSNI